MVMVQVTAAYHAAMLRYTRHRLLLARICEERARAERMVCERRVQEVESWLDLPPLLVSEAIGLPPVNYPGVIL